MKLNDNIALDFIEQDIFYVWGCPSYRRTLELLIALEQLTVNQKFREHITGLLVKLIYHSCEEQFEEIYHQNFQQLDQGMKKKFQFAKQLIYMEIVSIESDKDEK